MNDCTIFRFEQLGFRVIPLKFGKDLVCTRIVSCEAGRILFDCFLQRIEKLATLWPVAAGDQGLGTPTNCAAIELAERSKLDRVMLDLFLRPRTTAGHNEARIRSGGLNRFDPGTRTFRAYRHDPNDDNNLCDNNIHGILEDNQGYLWMSTSYGLSRFDPMAITFRNYDKFDGLQNNEFATNSYYKSSTGEMFFGGTAGLNAFYPDRLTHNSFLPPVVLTDFLLFNQSVPIGSEGAPLSQDISVTDRVTPSHHQSVFSIKFAALSYLIPQKNQYGFSLKRDKAVS